MAITQLSLFNDALGLLGDRSLVATSDATESARVLTALWDETRRYCLEQGKWTFAEKQATLTAIAPPTPAYGLANAFAKPADFVRLNAVASDANFENPVSDYHERGGYFYSDSSTMYIQYVSNDASFGYDLTKWPESFALFYTYYLAIRAAPRIAPQRLQETQRPDAQGNGGGYLGIGFDQAFRAALAYNDIDGGSTFLPDGATSKLSIFNAVLSTLSLPLLTKITDATESAKLLLNLWDATLKFCLEQNAWSFAEKQGTTTGGAPGSDPAYALLYKHTKPADFVRLNAIGTDLAVSIPVTDFHDRGVAWFTNSQTIYFEYVSNDASYGLNMALWPEAFTLFVTRYLAYRAATRINPALLAPSSAQGENTKAQDFVGYLEAEYLKALTKATEIDSLKGGPSHFWDTTEPSQLSIFNNAMNLIGGQQLTKLTDAFEHARVLHSLWPHVRDYCLEQGRWNFAEREVKLTPSLTELPSFGLQNAFDKPTDMIRVNEVAADEYFSAPIFQIHERGAFWYCDLEELFIRYISKDSNFGYDITKWPESFTLFVTLYLATRAAPRLAPNLKLELIRAGGNVGLEEAKKNALSKDAVSGPTQFLPQGNWSMARLNGRTRRGRNSRSSLYGN